MFYPTRYQTGEIDEVINDMREGNIPCMDVDDMDELNWVIGQLAEKGIYRVEDIPWDKNARDKIKEPEFEFRAAFYIKPVKSDELNYTDLMYIDFYFELYEDETYDPIGEI